MFPPSAPDNRRAWRFRPVSSSDLTLFHFENKPVRTIVRDGDGIWFVAADVCRIFELANVTMALRILDEDEKHTLTIVEGGNINGLGTGQTVLPFIKPSI
jgi:prophage antirepressor-like protein